MAKSPNWDRSYTECFGFTLENLGEAGAKSIEQKLRAIGLPVDDLLRFPMPMDLPPREWALRGQKMLRAGLLGDGEDSVVNDPGATAIMFDTIRRTADASRVPPDLTIQWDFTDAGPMPRVAAPGRVGCHGGPRRLSGPDTALLIRGLGRHDRGPCRSAQSQARPATAAEGSVRVLLALPKVSG